MRKIRITESGLKQLIMRIVEQVEETQDNIVKILASDFLKIFRYTNSVDAILNTKKYKDSKVVIVGDLKFPSNDKVKTLGRLHGVEGGLDVSSLPNLTSLGELKFVKGRLTISGTKVSSIDGIEVDGYISDYNTPIETRRLRKEFQETLDDANERRENGEWDDIDGNEEAAKAHALLEYLDNNDGGVNILDDEVKEELSNLKQRLELLNDQYNETDDDETVDILTQEIDEIQERIDEIESDYYDVYDVLPTSHNHYGEMSIFNFRGQGRLGNLYEFAVGTTDEADNALKEYYKNLIDDVGLDGLSEYIIENNIDGDSVADEFENYYEEEVRDNLDVYFNLDDLELSREQESRKADLERYIEELDEYIDEQNSIQSSLNDEIEDPQEYSDRYDEIQELIDDAERRRDDAQEEIDEMRGEVTDDMIQSEVEDKLYQIRRDPYDFLKDMGYDQKTILNFVDLDGVVEDLYSQGDYGDLNGYDGNFDEIKIGGDYYVVMRIN